MRDFPSLRLLLPLLLSLTSAAALAGPYETDIPILQITDFGAFVSARSDVPSHVSFHVRDGRPEYFAEVDCVFVTNETYPLIYLGGYWPCEGDTGIGFWLGEAFLKIRRPFLQDHCDVARKSYAVGLASQDTFWSSLGTVGECKNTSLSLLGASYSRPENWDFPINQIIA
ncbi:hypothetical protein BCR34DRAFT_577346 [Clohesyomyces aquaticus]|uniref:Uncharacterized protein n=1 Tax=Clohesyomyces aquaticus TaxID=1231657 RepID=A0A1Y1YJW4_9PLEO|nr:hypothetical protein BCR34DRAFT_577346 [Clohesyomyces aquaticus]